MNEDTAVAPSSIREGLKATGLLGIFVALCILEMYLLNLYDAAKSLAAAIGTGVASVLVFLGIALLILMIFPPQPSATKPE